MKNLRLPERASTDELRSLQLERLRWAVHHAYRNVEHYRCSFDARGVHPDGLRTLDDHYDAERLGCTVIPMSGGQTERQAQSILDCRPDIIMVTPSYALNIAEESARQGAEPRECSLSLGILGADPWTEAMRGELESVGKAKRLS